MRVILLLLAFSLSSSVFSQNYAIQAPGEAHIRQRIEVNWTAPQDNGGLLEIRPIEEGARRVAYSYVRNNPEGIEVPEAPGQYRIVLLFESEVRGSLPLTVVPADVPPGELLVTQSQMTLGSGDAVEIILDASGSMLQRLGSERRIEIAKNTLIDLVSDTIPPGTGFVLRAFGHREADSCRTDLEIPPAR